MNESKWKDIAERGTILRVLVGSEAYGLSLGSSSDRDEKGVCIEPLEVAMGFNGFEQYEYRTAAERGAAHDAPSQPRDLDLTIYSLQKFLRLALKGNPSIVEMLFIKPLKGDARGMQLQELAPYIVSKRAGAAYLGYMQAQRQRMLGERGGRDVNRGDLVEKYGFDTKYAMHMLRLGLQGIELLKTGSITIPVHDSVKSYLLGVRTGKYTLQEVTTQAGELEREVKDLLDSSPLPSHPNTEVVEDWMITTYWHTWKAHRVLLDRLPPDMRM